MRMYICAFPRMQALCSPPCYWACPYPRQTARIYSSGAQANLRIDAKVVPAIAVHHRDKDDRDNGKDKGRRSKRQRGLL